MEKKTLKRDYGVVDTDFSKVWLGEDGVCRSVLRPNIVVGLTEMRESLAAQKQVTEDGVVPVLVDMREIKNSTHEARKFAASVEYSRYVSAVAILENSVIGKILGNLFINFSRPIYPTKLFTSEDEAVSWLREKLQESKKQDLILLEKKNGKG